MHDALDRLLGSTALAAAVEHREVLETYRIIARDAGWIGRIREAIVGGLTAEAAVQRVRDDTRARMAGVEDPYIRERLADFEAEIGRASCRERVCQYGWIPVVAV